MHYFLCFLSLLLKSGVSENLITIPVDLGQNVTLNCSLNDEHIFWFRQRQLEGPVYILNSLGKAYDFAEYNQQHKEFRKKYLLQTSRLFIHNVTSNELGSYYCARLKDHLIFSNAVTLKNKVHKSIVNCPIQCNHTTIEPPDYLNSWMFIPFVVSFLLNCVFGTLLLAVLVRRSTQNKKNTREKAPHDPNPLQYADIILPSPRPTNTRHINSTYAVLKPQAKGQSYATNM